MARIVNSPLSANAVQFEYMSGSTMQSLTLDAASFMGGGGSGIQYSAGTGLTLNGVTFAVESTIYNKVNSLPAFGSATTTFLANNGTWQTPAGGGGNTWAKRYKLSYNSGTSLYDLYDVTTPALPVMTTFSMVQAALSSGCEVKITGDAQLGATMKSPMNIDWCNTGMYNDLHFGCYLIYIAVDDTALCYMGRLSVPDASSTAISAGQMTFNTYSL